MRIRFKPWARPELEASEFYRDNPEELKGKWIQEFKNKEKEKILFSLISWCKSRDDMLFDTKIVLYETYL